MAKDTKTPQEKLNCTIVAALIFLIISSPQLYKIVNVVISKTLRLPVIAVKGCPTIFGLLVHTVVFGLVIRYLMDM